jgi:DNA-binding NarL/FixJ family response regulator
MVSMLLWATCLAVLAAAVPTWVCLRLRAEFRAFKAGTASTEQLSEKTNALDVRVAALESRLANLDRTKDEHAEWLAQAESLNLNRRGQVLRLHRRGDSIPEIASTLRMRPGEVSLMIKVYEIGRDLPDLGLEKV